MKKVPKHGRFVRFLCVAVLVAVLACGFVVFCNLRVRSSGPILSPEEVCAGFGDADLILVLGAGVRPDGSPSDMLHDRVVTGVDLYERGAAPLLLFSGDSLDPENYDETGAMRRLALSLGVPEEAIGCDTLGLSTYESVARVAEIYGAKKIVIVTQEYHLYRALWIARRKGIEAVGVSADLRPYRGSAYREAREILARVKDYLLS